MHVFHTHIHCTDSGLVEVTVYSVVLFTLIPYV
jgi:hypothetical protein